MPAIDTHALVMILLIFALGVVSPGPNFLVVAQRSVARGRADGLVTVLGVATVSSLWAAGSLFGIGLLFALFPWAHLVLRAAGAAYLFWLGLKMWRNAHVPLVEATTSAKARSNLWRAYRAGLATNLSNTKAFAFYTSAFAAASPSPDQTATMWLAVGLMFVIALTWYGSVALALSSGPVAALYRRVKAPIERGCAVLMISFGAKLATG